MAIYEITSDSIRKIAETSFGAVGLHERFNLQRLLRSQIAVISPDTLVIAEEFGEWEDSRRRIDLLGIDKDANLVVIELKRTEDGGHMELQALRYAAMVSTMTFEKATEVFAEFLSKTQSNADPNTTLLDFLEWEEPDEDQFAQDVRVVLVSAEFSKELTTAVMWLNEHDLDIRCIRMKPYLDNGRTLIDVQQVVPLPEVAAYQVQIREKERRERKDRAERYDIRKRFWTKLLDYARTKTDLHADISPGEYGYVGAGAGVRGLIFNYDIRRHEAIVELYIDRGPSSETENKSIFDNLHACRNDIEAVFGEPLDWRRLDDKRACRIQKVIKGGYRDDEQEWMTIHECMVDAMVRLEKALNPYITKLKATL